jgi:hypothetical protein
MSLHQSLLRLAFTAIWGKTLNRSGFQVRHVHSLRQATVWDGAEERLVKYYFSARRVQNPAAPAPAEDLPVAGSVAVSELESAVVAGVPEYVVQDSRPPFAVALGVSRRLSHPLPNLVPAAAGGVVTSSTNSPFRNAYLAD